MKNKILQRINLAILFTLYVLFGTSLAKTHKIEIINSPEELMYLYHTLSNSELLNNHKEIIDNVRGYGYTFKPSDVFGKLTSEFRRTNDVFKKKELEYKIYENFQKGFSKKIPEFLGVYSFVNIEPYNFKDKTFVIKLINGNKRLFSYELLYKPYDNLHTFKYPPMNISEAKKIEAISSDAYKRKMKAFFVLKIKSTKEDKEKFNMTFSTSYKHKTINADIVAIMLLNKYPKNMEELPYSDNVISQIALSPPEK